MKIKVLVEERHIERGKMDEPNFCPIALALKEQLHLKTVYVGGEIVTFGEEEDEGLTVGLPNKAQDFITRFDCGEPVKPFSFTL